MVREKESGLHVRRVVDDAELALTWAIRRKVFIDEQGVSEADELDDKDAECTHFLALQGGVPVGCARLLISETKEAKAQRVAVLKEARGLGVGVMLMRALEEHAQKLGHHEVILGAQVSAVRFYERIGYESYGGLFLDAGIEHRMMRRPLSGTRPSSPRPVGDGSAAT